MQERVWRIRADRQWPCALQGSEAMAMSMPTDGHVFLFFWQGKEPGKQEAAGV